MSEDDGREADARSFIAKARLLELGRRTNGHACVRLLVHLALFALTSFVLFRAVESSRWWLLPAIVGHGFLLATFFGPLHECVHRTAFRYGPANDLVAWFSGLVLLLPGLHYREFHFEHHRHTQDSQRDPELAVRPREWPVSLSAWLRLQLRYLVVPALRLVTMAKLALSSRTRPFVREHRRRVVLTENLLALVIYASALIAAAVGGKVSLLLAWLASYGVAWLVFLWHIQCEHTGCALSGNQLERTRTMRSNAIWRFLMWNETYHGAHHAYPSIPFHALPVLDKELGLNHVHVVEGYLGVHVRVLRSLLGGKE